MKFSGFSRHHPVEVWTEPFAVPGALITDVATADFEFEAFMASRYAPLLRAARLLVLNNGVAEDLLQSALIKTYTHWSSLRTPAAAETYTHTIMTRLALRGRRRKWVAERATHPLPERPAPDESARSDAAVMVRRALFQLAVDQRAVLVLRYYVQLTEVETADALGCAVGTVKSRANRALASLRDSGLVSLSPDVLEVPRD